MEIGQDNVFRYNLGKDICKVETPLKVLNFEKGLSRVVNAVWDTGSTFSSISERVAQAIELPADGKAANIGTNGMSVGRTSFCFAFPGNGRYSAFIEANVLSDCLGLPDFIIGLDIISMGEFRLTREAGNNILTFIADKSVFMDLEGEPTEKILGKMQAFVNKIKKTGTKMPV